MDDLKTKSVHAGAVRPRIGGAITTPIFQSSTFEYHGEDYHDIGYIRLSTTPNHVVLGKRIAALHNAEASLATGSGMAAISATILTILSTGDHLIVQDCLYGGTTGLLSSLKRFGINHTAVDAQDPSSWGAARRESTRAIYFETLTNPLVQLADLKAVVEFAQEHGLVSIIDNTFASPVNFQPIVAGFDLAIESATKYMGGHSDICAGCVVGSRKRIEEIKGTLDLLGGSLDPHACFLLERGLKTIGLRVPHHNASAMRVAEFLSAHPMVEKVNYPGLPDHPQHDRAQQLLDGFGGMLSFELRGGTEIAEQFLGALRLPAVAVSLGGAESLIVRPATAVHAGLSPQERIETGITDRLIRFSVGLEETNDLLADFETALQAAEPG